MNGAEIRATLKRCPCKGPARAVYHVLLTHIVDKPVVWPSRTALAECSGLSLRTVARALNELEEAGAIARVGVSGRGSMRYQVRIYRSAEPPATVSGDEEFAAKSADVCLSDPCQRDASGVSEGHAMGDRVTPEDTIEDTIEVSACADTRASAREAAQPVAVDLFSEPVPVQKPAPKRSDNPDLTAALHHFQSVASKVEAWATPRTLTASRRTKLAARIAQAGGLDAWRAEIDRAAASEFLSGRSGRFAASFDWLLSEANFTKLQEGNYDRARWAGAATVSPDVATRWLASCGHRVDDGWRGVTIDAGSFASVAAE